MLQILARRGLPLPSDTAADLKGEEHRAQDVLHPSPAASGDKQTVAANPETGTEAEKVDP